MRTALIGLLWIATAGSASASLQAHSRLHDEITASGAAVAASYREALREELGCQIRDNLQTWLRKAEPAPAVETSLQIALACPAPEFGATRMN